MEGDCKLALVQWLVSSEHKVTPSLLATTLLFVNKAPNGLSALLHLLDQHWTTTVATETSTNTKTQPTVSSVTDTQVKCINLLAQTLTPSISTITPNSVKDLLNFISNKLTEPLVVPRFMDILLQLVEHDLCNTHQCITICQLLFTHIPGKKWVQSTRHKVFSILGQLLQRYAHDINRSPSLNFIEGFISIMDGEKDPRNLLMVFDLVRFIIDKLDISRHVEDIFDVVFCYFPISFTPPSHDPLAITSEELKLSLRLCLAASPYFAYFATPLLIEKLLSSTGSAKKDTMDTIRLCAPAYGAHALLPHAQDLFGALVKEVYQGSDLTMESIALETIHQVVATLATGISIVNIRDPVERAIEALLHQAVENLKEPELKNAKSASSILRAAGSASDPACTLVVNAVIPLLYQEYKITDPVARQKAVLGILIDILEASNSLYGSIDSTGKDRDLQTPLTLYKQQLLQIFVSSLINDQQPFDSQLRYQSLLGIRLMVIMKRFLSVQEIDITVAQLTRQALHNDRDIRALVLSTLAIVSKKNSNAIIRHTLPYLLEALESSSKNATAYQEILSAIKTLCVEPPLFCALAEPLLMKLNTACRIPAYADYSIALAECLYSTMSQIEITEQVLQVGQEMLYPAIITKCIKASATSDPSCWKLSLPLLNTLALIIAIIVRKSSEREQEKMVLDAFSVFVEGNKQVSDLSPGSTSYLLFGACSTPAVEDGRERCDNDITIFFPTIIGNCRKEIRLPVPSTNLLLQNLIEHASNIDCNTRQVSLSQTVAVIVNKWINDDMAEFLKQYLRTQIEPSLYGPDMSKRNIALVVLIWLTKGLVVRGHPLGFDLLNKLIELCHSKDLGSAAADGFAVILHQDDMILNRNSNAVISILYRQRVFHHCIPKFTLDLDHLYCLVALSHILTNIPTQVPSSEISKLMPPIIAALQVPSQDDLVLSMIGVAQSIVPWSTLSSSNGATKTNEDDAIGYLGDLLEALLALTIKHQRTVIRKDALGCLLHYARIVRSTNKRDLLHPYASNVIRTVGLALDDKKRSVRKEAVDCREQCILVFGYPVSRFLIEIQEPSIGMPLTKAVMVKEDIQTFYENLLDEVISAHSEEFLLSLTHSMTLEKVNALYRPQATLLLGSGETIPDACLFRMPQWIGKFLHDSHARTYAMVEPMVDDYMDRHWPSRLQQQEMTPDDIQGFLVLLNQALIAQIDQTMMDPQIVLSDLSLKLQTCQYRHSMSHESFLQRVTVRLFGVQPSRRTEKALQGDMQHHFLVKYLKELRSDFLSQLQDNIPELVQLVQTDLEDDFVSD